MRRSRNSVCNCYTELEYLVFIFQLHLYIFRSPERYLGMSDHQYNKAVMSADQDAMKLKLRNCMQDDSEEVRLVRETLQEENEASTAYTQIVEEESDEKMSPVVEKPPSEDKFMMRNPLFDDDDKMKEADVVVVEDSEQEDSDSRGTKRKRSDDGGVGAKSKQKNTKKESKEEDAVAKAAADEESAPSGAMVKNQRKPEPDNENKNG